MRRSKGTQPGWPAPITFLLLIGCLGSPAVRDGPTPRERLATAQAALREGKYEAVLVPARLAYETAQRVEEEIRGEALYLEAEGLFHLEDYFAAHEIYERILDKFPSHSRFRQAVEREFQIGTRLLEGEDPGRFLFFRIGREKDGIRILERIVDEFPAERFAEDSQFRIATYHFDSLGFEEAMEAYQRLITDFPASKWAAISLYRKGICVLRRSEGPEYDQTPYMEARTIFRRYLELYPRGDQVSEAEVQIRAIQEGLAKEEYSVALSYLRLGKPRAAVIYLRSILQNYPGTPHAEQARKTLDRIGLPEEALPSGDGKG